MSNLELQAPSVRHLGRYELLGLLAKGGMGEVYLARFKGVAGFEKRCVIKKILPHLAMNEGFVRKFLNEGKTLVSLTHSNIVQIFDMGSWEGEFYLAMEHVVGADLRFFLSQLKLQRVRVPLKLGIYIIMECLKGLSYAHRRVDSTGALASVIHRDVSPSNILISREGEVKIIDFGIAKDGLREIESIAGAIEGKFSYMSPEQARGEALDVRSDIFSAAVVLYEILTGERAFEGDSDLQSLERIRRVEYRAARELRDEIDETLDHIIQRALSNDLNERYQTADDFLLALGDYVLSNGMAAMQRELAEFLQTSLLSSPQVNASLSLDDFLNQAFSHKLLEQNREDGLLATQSLHFTQSFSDIIPSASSEDFRTPSLPLINGTPVAAADLLKNSNSQSLVDSSERGKRRYRFVLLALLIFFIILLFYFIRLQSGTLPSAKMQVDSIKQPTSSERDFQGRNLPRVETYFTKLTTKFSQLQSAASLRAERSDSDWITFEFRVDPPQAIVVPVSGRIERIEDYVWKTSTNEDVVLELIATDYEKCKFSILFDQQFPRTTWEGCELKSTGIDKENRYLFALSLSALKPAVGSDRKLNELGSKRGTRPSQKQRNAPTAAAYDEESAEISFSSNVPAFVRVGSAEHSLPTRLRFGASDEMVELRGEVQGAQRAISYKAKFNSSSPSDVYVEFCKLSVRVRESYLPGDPSPIQLADISIDGMSVAKSTDFAVIILPCGAHRVSLKHEIGSGILEAETKVELIAGTDKNISLTMH